MERQRYKRDFMSRPDFGRFSGVAKRHSESWRNFRRKRDTGTPDVGTQEMQQCKQKYFLSFFLLKLALLSCNDLFFFHSRCQVPSYRHYFLLV